MNMSKQRIAESIIQDKLGYLGLRIFKLLLIKKRLDQKQISELCMVPLKETLECLYGLLRLNYVQLQEFPKKKCC